METKYFNEVIEEQIGRCKDVLINKAKEYATEDRLHNFKTAAVLMACSSKQALAGFMAKHTVSVYDMCGSDETFPVAQWNEKITDHINYLLILRAIIEEERQNVVSQHNDAVNVMTGDGRIVATLYSDGVRNQNIISEDDKFFLIKALESGGMTNIIEIIDWLSRRINK